MRRLRLPLFLVLAVLVGIAWGLKIQKNTTKRKAPEADATTLKVLALKNTLPPSVIQIFEAQANIKIQLTEETTPEAVLAKLERDPSYDLVTLLNHQTSTAAATLKIQPLKFAEITGSSTISSDFLDLPGEASPTVIPLFWGLKGLETVPTEDVVLWILSLSLGGKSENPAGAKKFIEFLLKPTTAVTMSQQTHQASCNKAVEASTKLPTNLKPSYLRTIPLERIRIGH